MSIRNDVLLAVQSVGRHGITAAEIESLPKFASSTYHGPVSGHLSRLHADGVIERLSERRTSFLNGKNRSFKIYVTPMFVLGRETEPQGR